MSVHQPSWYVLTPYFLFHYLWRYMKIPEKTEEDSHNPKPAGEGDIQMKYSWSVTQPKFQNSNKKVTCMNLHQYRCLLIIWHLFSPMGAGLTEFYFLWITRPLWHDFGLWSKSLISSVLDGVQRSASHSRPVYPQGRSLWYPLWDARWHL